MKQKTAWSSVCTSFGGGWAAPLSQAESHNSESPSTRKQQHKIAHGTERLYRPCAEKLPRGAAQHAHTQREAASLAHNAKQPTSITPAGALQRYYY